MSNDFDVVVIGGSTTGVAAAVSAQRIGAKTCLIEKNGYLGGTATAAFVNRFQIGYGVRGEGVIRGVFQEICEGLAELNGIDGDVHKVEAAFDNEALKKVCMDLCLREGVTLYLHSLVADVHKVDDTIQSVALLTLGGLRRKIRGKVFIDATGNGDVSFMAGADVEIGRPFDGLLQPMTLIFQIKNIDPDELKKVDFDALWPRFYRETGIRTPSRRRIVMEPMTLSPTTIGLCMNHVKGKNPLDVEELTSAEIHARDEAYRIYSFFKKNVPGFRDCELITSAEIGIRETRRVMGDYVLNRYDILGGQKFADAVGCSTAWIDLHNPLGEGVLHEYPPKDEWWEIPYRALLVKGIDNLLVAGRCISATPEAQSAIRVIPTCIATGQGAGAAAGLATTRELPLRSLSIHELQDVLRSQNVWFGQQDDMG